MCGSPTVILKLTFAASSTLTLGEPPLLPVGVASTTGGGALPPSLSSCSFATSCGSLGPIFCCCGAPIVVLTTTSFCGGAGGALSLSLEELPPRGPSGSSTADRRVGWATRRRGVRGPRLGAEDWVEACEAGSSADCVAGGEVAAESAQGDSKGSMVIRIGLLVPGSGYGWCGKMQSMDAAGFWRCAAGFAE